jgi:hypothetical protein
MAFETVVQVLATGVASLSFLGFCTAIYLGTMRLGWKSLGMWLLSTPVALGQFSLAHPPHGGGVADHGTRGGALWFQ